MLLITVACVLTGCAGRDGVRFTNVSNSWLNVQFYVGDEQDKPTWPTEPTELVRLQAMQLAPGGTADYCPKQHLVHVQVEMVSPTWVPTGREYWIELLTRPPLHIVADGGEDRLEFRSFDGEVAIIPDKERAERFTYLDAPRPKAVVTPAPHDGEAAMTDATQATEGWDE